MVTQYGMSERLGAIKLGHGERRAVPRPRHGPPARLLRGGRRRRRRGGQQLIETAHDEAWEILVENRDVLDDLVLELLEKETLDKAQVAEVFAHIRKRPARPAWTGSIKRSPAGRPGA